MYNNVWLLVITHSLGPPAFSLNLLLMNIDLILKGIEIVFVPQIWL